ncbi:hypothetical protein BT96DRAFT_737471, partial [Gymnopus androsaceus JB14]
EFAWTDSAYTCNSRTVPVHKEPASFHPENAIFDKTLSRLRVRSEHCMGLLKGRFQCLRGLRLQIRNNEDHVAACRWITICIILHNFLIEVEGSDIDFTPLNMHGRAEETEDGVDLNAVSWDGDDDDALRRQLVAEIVAFKS